MDRILKAVAWFTLGFSGVVLLAYLAVVVFGIRA